jgi:hypothetical protein
MMRVQNRVRGNAEGPGGLIRMDVVDIGRRMP